MRHLCLCSAVGTAEGFKRLQHGQAVEIELKLPCGDAVLETVTFLGRALADAARLQRYVNLRINSL